MFNISVIAVMMLIIISAFFFWEKNCGLFESRIFTFSMCFAISIDLGTRFSKGFCIPEEGRDPVLIRSLSGKEKIPTFVGIDEGRIIFGEEASSMLTNHPENVVANLISYVGRKFDEDLKNSSSAKMIKGEDNSIFFEISGQNYSVTECLAYFIDGY